VSPPAAASLPPENVVPDFAPAPGEASIVTLREEQGGLLTGTVFDQGLSPAVEQNLFVGALRLVAAQEIHPAPAVPQFADGHAPAEEDRGRPVIPTVQEAAHFAIERLYEMAEFDERVGEFKRADQWRGLARGLRQTVPAEKPAEASAPIGPSAGPSPATGPSPAKEQAEPSGLGAPEFD
jgi:hypothetical protein